MPQSVIDYASPSTPRSGRRWRGLFGWFLFGALAITLFLLLNAKQSPYTTIPLSEFRAHMVSGNVQTVTITADRITGRFRKPQSVTNSNNVLLFASDLPQGPSSL